jgi:hypothetical protein
MPTRQSSSCYTSSAVLAPPSTVKFFIRVCAWLADHLDKPDTAVLSCVGHSFPHQHSVMKVSYNFFHMYNCSFQKKVAWNVEGLGRVSRLDAIAVVLGSKQHILL